MTPALEQLAQDLLAPLPKEEAARRREHLLVALRAIDRGDPGHEALDTLAWQLRQLLRPPPAAVVSHDRPAGGEGRPG